MDMEQTFQATLGALPCPVSKPPADGRNESYVAFVEVLGTFDGYASNEPRRLVHMVQVHAYSKRDDGYHRTLLTEAIELMRAAGIRVRSYGPDDYEKDTGYHHIAITCEWTENV